MSLSSSEEDSKHHSGRGHGSGEEESLGSIMHNIRRIEEEILRMGRFFYPMYRSNLNDVLYKRKQVSTADQTEGDKYFDLVKTTRTLLLQVSEKITELEEEQRRGGENKRLKKSLEGLRRKRCRLEEHKDKAKEEIRKRVPPEKTRAELEQARKAMKGGIPLLTRL